MILSNDERITALRLKEKSYVEESLLWKLAGLGWTVVRPELQQEPR